MKRAAIGELEQLVLLAVLRLRDGAYTVAIREEIAGRTGRALNRGAVYVTLERLERKGYLSSRFGQPSPQRGGKAKKFFEIEAEGLQILEESYNELLAMREGIDFAQEER